MSFFLSVIIPTYQRAAQLERQLKWLLQQRVERSSSEVIVVDDGSQDETSALLERYAKEEPWIRPLRQENSGQAVARQSGVAISRGQILLFLDDDMEPATPDFLELHRNFHLKTGLSAVALGAILPPLGFQRRPAFEYFYERSIRKMYEGFTSGKTTPSGQHFFSANVSLPKKLFLSVGGFSGDYRHAEDRELGLRIEQRTHARFFFLEGAAAFHHSPTGRFSSFVKRARLYGAYELRMAESYPERFDLHPRMILRHPNPVKRSLAHLVWWLPLLAPLGYAPLVGLAKALNRIGLVGFAIPVCSVLYTLNYVRGYRDESRKKSVPGEDRSHAA